MMLTPCETNLLVLVGSALAVSMSVGLLALVTAASDVLGPGLGPPLPWSAQCEDDMTFYGWFFWRKWLDDMVRARGCFGLATPLPVRGTSGQ